MVVTADIYLPSEEELTVQEVNLSGPALRAGAFHYGKYCEFQNNVRFFNDKGYLFRSREMVCVIVLPSVSTNCYVTNALLYDILC
jgi:hypothetical protein